MKGKLACVLVITMFILMAVPATSANVDAEYEKELPSNAEVKFTDRSVAVLSDSSVGNSISSALSQSTSKLNVMDSISVANAKDITIIDSAWAATKEADVINNGVKTLIESNKAVILLDDSPDLIKQSGAEIGLFGFVDNAQAYGIINTTSGQTYCYSVGGYDDIQEAMVLAYNWADEIYENTKAYALNNTQWIKRGAVDFSDHTDKGIIRATTEYYQYVEDDPDYNYYYTHYIFDSEPNSNKSCKGLNIYNKVDGYEAYGYRQSLLSSGPTADNRDRVLLTAQEVISGIQTTFSVSWDYKYLSSTGISNNTNFSMNALDIDYSLGEKNHTSAKLRSVEPGNLVKVSTEVNGNYYCTEEYTAEFCDVVISNLWHNNFKKYSAFNYVTVYDGNGISSVVG